MKRKTSILQIVHSLKIGGSEKLALSIASELDDSRFQTAVCALDLSGDLVKDFKERHIPQHVLHRNGVEFATFRKIYSLLKLHEVDIVHTHNFAQLFHALLPAKVAGAKIIHTEHSYYNYLPRNIDRRIRNFDRRMIRPLLYLCERFTVVSEEIADFFIHKIGISKGSISVIPNGIDVGKFDIKLDNARMRLGLQEDDIVIGTVGRLEEEKDHRTLLNAFKYAENSYPNCKLLIVGDGTKRKELEDHSCELQIYDKVKFLGNRSDIPELLSAMDIFVLTSIREGLPLSALEAMAARKPVVATDVGGLKHIVKDGVSGFLVSKQDDIAIGDALIHLIKDSGLQKNMGDKGHDIAEGSFGIKKMIREYEDIYRSMIGESRVLN